MFVERAARHPGFAHDVGDRRGGVALRGDRTGHAFEQAPAVLVFQERIRLGHAAVSCGSVDGT
jgi:hypothetical protein